MAADRWHPEIEEWLARNPMPREEAEALLNGPGNACACIGIVTPGIPKVRHDPAFLHACECSLRYERARRAMAGPSSQEGES